MEINGSPPALATPRLQQAALSSWQVGQVLQAVVVKQATPQSVILQVANQQLQAETNVSLSVGQRLELTVAQTGNQPLLQARLLTPAATANSQARAQSPVTNKANSAATTTQPALSPDKVSSQTPLSPGRNPTTAAQTVPSTPEAVTMLMKQALPKQASMTSLLANIAWLNNQTSQTVATLPKPVIDIVKQLFKDIPAKENLGENGQIKQNINNSGIFLENKLQKAAGDNTDNSLKQTLREALLNKTDKADTTQAKAGPEKTGTDLKASLLRLLGTINQITRVSSRQGSPTAAPIPMTNAPALPFTPPTLRGHAPTAQTKIEATLQTTQGNAQLLLLELGKQTEAALARTQLHQAASLSSSESGNTGFAFELPIRNNEQLDLFDVLIEKDESHDKETEDAKHAWSVTLAFDLDGLGPVHAKLRLVEGKISTLFWVDRAETRELVNQHLSDLLQRYQQSGLETDELHCYQGTPPGASASAIPRVVLDVNA